VGKHKKRRNDKSEEEEKKDSEIINPTKVGDDLLFEHHLSTNKADDPVEG